MSQMWLQDDPPQVEIIELDSDDSKGSPNKEQDSKFGHIWNYINREPDPVDETEYYRVNHEAREKRRKENERIAQASYSPDDADEYSDVITDFMYASLYGGNDFQNNRTTSHQTNCFTIVNRPFNNSDSSSDDFEIRECPDAQDNWNDAPRSYNGDMLSLEDNVDTNKRTVWIYSFKNKRELSENHFELVNVPSLDSESTTSHSLENYSEAPDGNTKHAPRRVASPVPATYVPRLNLRAPILPTLTEVTEPIKKLSKQKQECCENNHKVFNGWFDDDDIGNTVSPRDRKHFDKEDKSSNTHVINWMCLSPRERRRRFKHTSSNTRYQTDLSVVLETPSAEPKLEDSYNSPMFKKIETVAEINIVSDGSPKDKKELFCDNSSRSKTKNMGEILIVDIDDEKFDSDHEDYSKTVLHKPQIRISNKRTKSKLITDPIEKLDGSWILEEKQLDISKVEEKNVTKIDTSMNTQDTNVESPMDCAGNRLWARNMSLLKPAEWSEYRAITDDIPSLQLSYDTDSVKNSCLNSLVKCFKCFK